MIRATLFALLLLAVPCLGQNQPAPFIADPDSRTTISLDGTWNSIVDPYEVGHVEAASTRMQSRNRRVI